jgi:hypothetical protein
MGGYTGAVYEQLFGKQVPAKQTIAQRPLLGSRFLTMQQLDYNNGRSVFAVWSVPRCYKQGTMLELGHFCAGVCEERTRGARFDNGCTD